MPEPLRAPFPWYGGKRRTVDVVWRAFDPEVSNYVEPLFGSGAVLLGRPGGAGKIETINDLDADVANFWRAVVAAPELVAHHADWPVNEADLHARHVWLVERLPEHRARMHAEAQYFDAERAGLWVWGLCQWIGGGWVAEPRSQKRPRLANTGTGVNLSQQIPNLCVESGASGCGVHASGRRPHLSNAGIGVNSPERRPDLTNAHGVHLPSLGNDRGLNGVAAAPCLDWFRELQARLRRVRVACGDWSRVLGPSVLGKGKNVGGRRPCAVFLDPPYPPTERDPGLYREDAEGVAEQVRLWAIEHGDDPDLRIALCGYAGACDMPGSWTEHAWKGARGYAGEANANRERERIYFSPHCLPIEPAQAELRLEACR